MMRYWIVTASAYESPDEQPAIPGHGLFEGGPRGERRVEHYEQSVGYLDLPALQAVVNSKPPRTRRHRAKVEPQGAFPDDTTLGQRIADPAKSVWVASPMVLHDAGTAQRGDLGIALGVHNTLEASLLRRDALASVALDKGEGSTQSLPSEPAAPKPKRGRRKMAAAVGPGNKAIRIPHPYPSGPEMAADLAVMKLRAKDCLRCTSSAPYLADSDRRTHVISYPDGITEPCLAVA